MSTTEFYNHLADEYDSLTGRSGEPENLKRVLKAFVERTGVRRVIDAACGTGTHSRILASLGVELLGVDNSPEMIRLARAAADGSPGQLRFERADLLELPKVAGDGWDAVLCLGNSLPHLGSRDELQSAMRSFWDVLRSGGIVVLQLLNYELLIRRNERIVAITRSGPVEFIRFNDYLGDKVRFNVLRIEWQGDKARANLLSTELTPFSVRDVQEALTGAGFTGLAMYSDLRFGRFDPERSRSVVVMARKR